MTEHIFHAALPFAAVGMIAFILYTVNRSQRLFALATLTSVAAFTCVTVVLAALVVEHGVRLTLLQGARYLILAWVIMTIYFAAEFAYRIRLLGSILMPAALMLILVSMFDDTVAPKIEVRFGSVTTLAHVILVFLGLALVFLSAAAAILYLVKTYALKNHRFSAVDDNLPSLSVTCNLMETAFAGGFPAFTVGMVLGVIYAGTTLPPGWIFEAKIVWAFIDWALYSLLFFWQQSRKISSGTLARGIIVLALVTAAAFFFSRTSIADRQPTSTRSGAKAVSLTQSAIASTKFAS